MLQLKKEEKNVNRWQEQIQSPMAQKLNSVISENLT